MAEFALILTLNIALEEKLCITAVCYVLKLLYKSPLDLKCK